MAVLYRSHFAMIRNPLINSRGINVSGLRGLVWTLITLLEREKPDYLAVATDSPEATFRHRMYAPYKATREKMAEELIIWNSQKKNLNRLTANICIEFNRLLRYVSINYCTIIIK